MIITSYPPEPEDNSFNEVKNLWLEKFTAAGIVKFLSKQKLSLEDEKITQREIEEHLKRELYNFKREHHFDKSSIIDFYFPGEAIGLEIKIGFIPKKEILRQITRYCNYKEVKSLILVTNKSMGVPEQINGKDIYVLNLGKAWL